MENERDLENKRRFELLKEFLESYLDFAENGEGESTKWIKTSCGLCSNWLYWFRMVTLPCERTESLYDSIRELLEEDFPQNCEYPFGLESYNVEVVKHAHHKNPKRLAWVRKTIKSLEIKIAEAELREDMENNQ